jgi:plasmid stability protein
MEEFLMSEPCAELGQKSSPNPCENRRFYCIAFMLAKCYHNAIKTIAERIMAQFTIRGFSDKLYKQLKKRAEASRRSLESEVKMMLSIPLLKARPRLTKRQREERLLRLKAIRSRVKPNNLDILAILREERDQA